MKLQKIVVIGGTGTVGKNVAGIFASFGNANVYSVGRNLEKAGKACLESALSVKAITVKSNIFPVEMDNLEEVVKDADLIFESVTEDLTIKKQIHSRINKTVENNTIIATGSSGLSIDELADCYDTSKRKHFMGIHFFNPPYNLSLCELIPSKYNEEKLINNVRDYLTNKLLRNTIIVKNEPAFLANRIGFMFMNEALQYAVEYSDHGGIDYIDAILGRYTGRNMKPLETVDFVGLDVHKAIVDNVYNNSVSNDNNYFILPGFINKLIEAMELMMISSY